MVINNNNVTTTLPPLPALAPSSNVASLTPSQPGSKSITPSTVDPSTTNSNSTVVITPAPKTKTQRKRKSSVSNVAEANNTLSMTEAAGSTAAPFSWASFLMDLGSAISAFGTNLKNIGEKYSASSGSAGNGPNITAAAASLFNSLTKKVVTVSATGTVIQDNETKDSSVPPAKRKKQTSGRPAKRDKKEAHSKDSLAHPMLPKRPPSGYLLFCMEHRPGLVASSPTLSAVDITKRLAEQWEKCQGQEREQYMKKAKILQEEYETAKVRVAQQAGSGSASGAGSSGVSLAASRSLSIDEDGTSGDSNGTGSAIKSKNSNAIESISLVGSSLKPVTNPQTMTIDAALTESKKQKKSRSQTISPDIVEDATDPEEDPHAKHTVVNITSSRNFAHFPSSQPLSPSVMEDKEALIFDNSTSTLNKEERKREKKEKKEREKLLQQQTMSQVVNGAATQNQGLSFSQ